MRKLEVVQHILGEKRHLKPRFSSFKTFAPSNIALCKYWGKRDTELNLPVTPSLSVSLDDKGAEVEITPTAQQDRYILNDQLVDLTTSFAERLRAYLNLFRQDNQHFDVAIQSNIPIAAGLASSASGFASIIQALNGLFGWDLSSRELSILARLGSGSACRSIESGFVEWHQGLKSDGMDSYGEKIEGEWPSLCVGLLILNEEKKLIGSREAMLRTVNTSSLYSAWPTKVAKDLGAIKTAIQTQDFHLFGSTAESNALTMHATMLSAWPAICYATSETISQMHKIWRLRQEGLDLYFTQDAGPNLKLLFLENIQDTVVYYFPQIEVVKPFNNARI